MNDPQLIDAQSARAAAEAAGLNPEEIADKVAEAVAAGRKTRLAKANSPLSDPEPGATLESRASAPHITDAAALVQDDLYKTRTILLKPDNIVESSQKAIQTELDNLADKTKRHLEKMSEYSLAVSSKIDDDQFDKEVQASAEAIASFEKISVDKMMEFSLKTLNANTAAAVSELPSSARFQFADVKEGFTKKLAEDYLGITDGLVDSIKGVLMESLDLKNKEKAAKEAAKSLPKDKPQTYADVSICTSEQLIGKTVALKRDKINKANDNMLKNMNMFLGDLSSGLAGLTGALGDIKIQIPDIEGSITSALQFTNASSSPNIFPFQMPPVPSVSDFYTMAEGSGAQPDAATPSPLAIADIASDLTPPDITIPKIPFAEPFKGQGMVDLVKDKVTEAASEQGKAALAASEKAALDMF